VLSTIQRSRARSAEILHDLNRLRASSLHKLFENDGGSNEVLLGDMVTLQRGYDLPSQDRKLGEVPVVSSSGVSGHHCSGKEVGPGVVIGRYGTLGQGHFIEAGPYWPLNTTLFVKDFHENDPRFVAYFLETIAYESHNDKTSVPGINRNDLHALRVLWPSKADQSRIARVLSVIDRRIAAEEATGLRLGQIFASAAAALLGGAG
jgi:type I restriction enzyme S subunit